MKQSRTQQLRKAAADRSRRRNGPAGGLVEVTCRHGPHVVTLVRTWPGADRHYERALKRRREAPRLCPACHAAGRSRGLIATNPPLRPLHRIGPGVWTNYARTITLYRDGRAWVATDAAVELAVAPTLRALVLELA